MINHYTVSMAKSGIRIVAGYFLLTGDFWSAGCLIIAAEVLGVLEEMVDKRKEQYATSQT